MNKLDVAKLLRLYISNIQWHLEDNGGHMSEEGRNICEQRIRDWEQVLWLIDLPDSPVS